MGTPAPLSNADLSRHVADLERRVVDMEQKFDTLETPWWKRLWFWVEGWPHHRLNAERREWRPWRRS